MATCLISGFDFFLNHRADLNVRMAASDAEGKQALYLAEAGLNQKTWQLQQANCSGYTYLINIPFGCAT